MNCDALSSLCDLGTWRSSGDLNSGSQTVAMDNTIDVSADYSIDSGSIE